MTLSTDTSDPGLDARRRRTVLWVVGLATLGLIFDGYDLAVYGVVVSTFLRDPSQIGQVTPELAGALGSYALIGVLVGALLAGTVGGIIGRRKVMLAAYAWFAIGMGVTALMPTTTLFGLMRFVTGLGVGALVATTGALVAEYAPAGKKNQATAIAYAGVPIGSLMAALLGILLLGAIGWRGSRAGPGSQCGPDHPQHRGWWTEGQGQARREDRGPPRQDGGAHRTFDGVSSPTWRA